MPSQKVAVSMDAGLLKEVDGLVNEGMFTNRSQAIQSAVREQLRRLRRSRLARECAKLDPVEEQAMAEEGFAGDAALWPEY